MFNPLVEKIDGLQAGALIRKRIIPLAIMLKSLADYPKSATGI
jgi:hypothetical protein